MKTAKTSIWKAGRDAAWVAASFLAACTLLSCDGSGTSPTLGGDAGAVYPAYVDANANGVNDYLEAVSHDACPLPSVSGSVKGAAPLGHGFTDANGDGICDFGQDGSATWHGPGCHDADGDGICDCWDEDCPCDCTHLHLQFRDRNRNGWNDFFERRWHERWGHGFVDLDGDGICDRGQDGSPSWHGPGYVDADGDGICDYWQRGRRN